MCHVSPSPVSSKYGMSLSATTPSQKNAAGSSGIHTVYRSHVSKSNSAIIRSRNYEMRFDVSTIPCTRAYQGRKS